MDAKKKALTVKPRYLFDTKAFKYLKIIYVGALIYTVVCGYFGYKYFRSHPDRYYNTNPVAQYYKSEEYLISQARFIGILPPVFKSKIDVEKFQKSLPRGSAEDIDA